MNDRLVELYVTNYTKRKGIVVNKGEFILNKLSQEDVSYCVEVQDEHFNREENSVAMTVVMYLPGAAITGIGTSSDIDYAKARKKAYADAVKTACSFYGIKFDDTKATSGPEKENNKVNDKPVDDDKEEIETQPEPTPEPTPAPKKSKFTEEQIEGMKQVKEKFQIEDDETFNRFLRAWNPEVTSKKMLTPENIDDFLNFMNEGSL